VRFEPALFGFTTKHCVRFPLVGSHRLTAWPACKGTTACVADSRQLADFTSQMTTCGTGGVLATEAVETGGLLLLTTEAVEMGGLLLATEAV
jgi:hypothetical protein